MTYLQQLKDPRWQRRRLEILQRSDFSCEECGSTEKTLHVHHKRYRKGAKAWEYDDSELIALCEDCHNQEHGLSQRNPGFPKVRPAEALVNNYIETWKGLAFEYEFVALAECRACGNPVLCGAELDGDDLTIMSCGRGPSCSTHRCGDKFPAVILGYCHSWEVLL